jgi:DNA-binding CsgD family transcriptional regulator
LCIGRKHAFFSAGTFCLFLGPLLFISKDDFLIHNSPAILFLIIAFSFGVSGFLNVLEKTYKEEIALKEEIFEKDKSITLEQYKRLSFELETKQKELTAKTMFMVEYAEKNTALFDELKTFKTVIKKQDQIQLDEVIQRYCIENSEKYWKEFETSFLEGNPEFYKKLSLICAELSPAELKLATLLRLGLSSKQIGSLTSNTPASVDVARSRLRNKLNLPSNTNLASFLLSI